MLKKGFQAQIVKGFHTSSSQFARHSNIRRGKAVCDPPLQPAPKSEFFASLPNKSTFFNTDRFRFQNRPGGLAQTNLKDTPIQPTVPSEIDSFQFGIGPEENKFIVETAPTPIADANFAFGKDALKYTEAGKLVMKSVSLLTANAKQITAFNIQKCIEKFGKTPRDSGSPEVQAAIWTLRIRNLEAHGAAHHKDSHNRRRLILMYHKRAKILRYLKRESIERYIKALQVLGITQEMVEGEISIRQKHN
ncbi:hypothetical protein DSO57_1010297 [Entomophthora muscae]|uniref:Uncharacterized protein n=1 Tax=Entomophthora muscae TaxID=34485 RepID=A0ACC2U558_9FUNG|nr:hypothetical protein DSO57_1010297 [Entomophthora muscae]